MSTATRADRPVIDWSDASDWDNTACVVALPHSADRLHVGMLIGRTEPAAAGEPTPNDIKSVERQWGRRLTFREAWQDERDRLERDDLPDDPPEHWYPDEGTPAWQSSDEPREGFEEIWVVSWA